jgi:hypothetical protein
MDALAAVNLTLDSNLSGMLGEGGGTTRGGRTTSTRGGGGRGSDFHIPNEQWQVFDPNDEEEDREQEEEEGSDTRADQNTRGRNTSRTSSTLSDIERVRGAQDDASVDYHPSSVRYFRLLFDQQFDCIFVFSTLYAQLVYSSLFLEISTFLGSS